MYFFTFFGNAKKYILNFKANKTIRDVQWSFLSLITASLAHLLLRIVIGKELGSSGLGLYTLVFTIYLFGMQFAAFGFGEALTKYIAEYENDISKIKEWISSGTIGSIISGLLMGIILYSFSTFISVNFFHISEMITPLRITALCFPFIAIQKTVIGILNGSRKMNHFALINILQNTSVFLTSIFFVFFLKMGVIGATIGFVAPTIIIGVISLLYIRNQFFLPSRLLLRVILKEMTWFGFYIVLGNSIGMIIAQIGSLLIGRFMGETDVGYYAVAGILIQGMTLLPSAVQRVTAPAIATYYGKKEYSKIKGFVENTMLKVMLIELIFLVFLILFGEEIIVILFSDKFMPAYTPMLILSIGYFIYAPFLSVCTIFASIGKINFSFKLDVLCATLSVILDLLLIPLYGLIGAALATTFSLTFTVLINLYFMNKYNKMLIPLQNLATD